ncbi:hypothetical protein HHL19_16265 [Streptomyces sp. R302]|uniref:hypothetical protein n=1 Tax=unclassified Streptomyces TaxID=2593676 RepID=UPI00145D560A|nr:MULTISPECIES: hypothetical protein [unclassified Streptomyces]NML55327.1 hypothetical protein [Streptomyces sp. R301]NML80199.1 hypothetical protein [Streptomyces sp. R302]
MRPLSPCDCPHCTPQAPVPAAPADELEPTSLPSRPQLFRVHYPDGRTQDATLHPDGRLSTNVAGQTHWSPLTLDDMRRANWAPPARIEWNPEPTTPPASSPAAVHPPSPATFDDEEHTS